MMVKGIESLCDHLPGKTAILCREEVEMVLPVALKFISGFVVSNKLKLSSGLSLPL